MNAPRLTPAMQAGTRFIYPVGMEGSVDLVDLIVPRPGVKPATFRSRVRRRTAAPPRQPKMIMTVICINYHFYTKLQTTCQCQLVFVTGHLPELKGYVDTDQFAEDRMKRFPCTQCNCSFSMRTNLRRHVKKAHCQPLWRPIPSVTGWRVFSNYMVLFMLVDLQLQCTCQVSIQ